jgi:G:T-mismatch repair DNA endonuclease (very short patch repair protein)
MSILENYIQKHGEDEGRLKYKELCAKRAFTLENQIAKYGVEEGTRRFNEKRERDKIKGTLQYYVEKYGEDEGERKYKEKNSKLSVGIETLKRNGKTPEEISKIKSIHSKNSAITLDGFNKKYGEEEGTKKYNAYIQRIKSKSCRTIDGWIHRGYSEEEAIVALKEYQSTSSIEKYIEKYDIEEGTKKYLELNLVKTRNLLKYKKSVSKLETYFFNDLANIIELDLERGRSCKIHYEHKTYYCDYFHSKNNKIIEIFGDFWHMNPQEYNFDDDNVVMNKTAGEIWRLDETRISDLKILGYVVLILWESDIKKNLSQQLLLAKQFLET